jgi:hypothetical protein
MSKMIGTHYEGVIRNLNCTTNKRLFYFNAWKAPLAIPTAYGETSLLPTESGGDNQQYIE